MSYNVRYASSGDKGSKQWKVRLPIMAEAIKIPSIVGFQEVLSSQLADLKKVMVGYSYVGVGRNDGKASGEHVPIFYRNDHWKKADHGHFWLSDTPEKPGSRSWGNSIPRMCSWVRLLDKNGYGIYVYNTHFDHRSSKSREMAAAYILKRINDREHKENPAILLGDLNCLPESKPLKILLDDKIGLLDSFTINGGDPKNSTTFNGWKAGVEGNRKIDYILASFRLKVLSSEILNLHQDGVVASDHNAIVTKIHWVE